MKSINLHLVVAGATYFNQLDRFQGWSGTPLTPAGQQASLKVGHQLGQLPLTTAFASDTSRSVQTGRAVLTAATQENVELQALSDLRAPFFGGFEGLERAAVWSGFATKLGYGSLATFAADQTPSELQTLLHDHDSAGLAESGAEFWQRYVRGLQTVFTATPDHGHALVIVDSSSMRALLYRATGEQPHQADLAASAVATLTYDGDNLQPLSEA
ncbi:phosphoglycerate mutase family protein [Lactiplantibacillus garii]|uniref:phosphoglycerate mutase (2,3-diphosphoglycerate-dependent) n=1 Tax=Lactiplantibacillus garii TaxID=2306423 RepID=A0A3R8J8K8_9LACO|nr:phosphoglycerate mutase family protein [Lactiplantibacillus garii]RRK11336.1 phosphoglycerate mutase family protein [Lactiplantibacillus garii]